jgi:hypothetical protein
MLILTVGLLFLVLAPFALLLAPLLLWLLLPAAALLVAAAMVMAARQNRWVSPFHHPHHPPA